MRAKERTVAAQLAQWHAAQYAALGAQLDEDIQRRLYGAGDVDDGGITGDAETPAGA